MRNCTLVFQVRMHPRVERGSYDYFYACLGYLQLHDIHNFHSIIKKPPH